MPSKPIQSRSFRMEVVIKQDRVETTYHVRPIESAWHVRSFQFRKEDGMVYHVTQDISGKKECNCGDGEWRDHPCKHCKVCSAMGLFLTPHEIQALRWRKEGVKR